MKELAAYHALAIVTEGDYQKITAQYLAYGTFARAWEVAAKQFPHIDAVHELAKLKSLGIVLVLNTDQHFPPALREIPHAPHALYIRGQFPLCREYLAIVGTRKATPYGLTIAKKFAHDISTHTTLGIVSGLALGIDGAAHRGALEACGNTVAILPCGLDTVYPPAHEHLAKQILKANGTLISEYPPQSPTYPARFLERNRIISGMTRGTLIVEAPLVSGALATARFALEQNRNVYVVPGLLTAREYIGSNKLIQSGAMLVTQPQDIAEDLKIPFAQPEISSQKNVALTPTEVRIYNVIRGNIEPLTIDNIIESAKLEPQTVSQTITFLLLRDIIREDAGKYSIK